MIIYCCADLHGFFPLDLPGGDLLIICGDLTARDTISEYFEFDSWLKEQDFQYKIVIGGNHDNVLFENKYSIKNAIYLCDQSIQILNYKIYGSPWTKTFPNMNPHCKAFSVDTEQELAEKFSVIPKDTNILITHSPVYGFLDRIHQSDGSFRNAGSKALLKHIDWDYCLQLHVCGHIHEGYGEIKGQTTFFRYHSVNASHVNERYQPVNKPIRVIL